MSNSPSGQEISDDDLDLLGLRQIPLQGALDGAAAATRAAEQQLFVRGEHCFFRAELAQLHEAPVLKIGAREHLIKTVGQPAGQGSFDFQAQVAPAAGDAISFIIGRDVESANEGDLLITNQQLAMVANLKAV